MSDPEKSAGDLTNEAESETAGARLPADDERPDVSREEDGERDDAENRRPRRRRVSREVNLRFLVVRDRKSAWRERV